MGSFCVGPFGMESFCVIATFSLSLTIKENDVAESGMLRSEPWYTSMHEACMSVFALASVLVRVLSMLKTDPLAQRWRMRSLWTAWKAEDKIVWCHQKPSGRHLRWLGRGRAEQKSVLMTASMLQPAWAISLRFSSWRRHFFDVESSWNEYLLLPQRVFALSAWTLFLSNGACFYSCLSNHIYVLLRIYSYLPYVLISISRFVSVYSWLFLLYSYVYIIPCLFVYIHTYLCWNEWLWLFLNDMETFCR